MNRCCRSELDHLNGRSAEDHGCGRDDHLCETTKTYSRLLHITRTIKEGRKHDIPWRVKELSCWRHLIPNIEQINNSRKPTRWSQWLRFPSRRRSKSILFFPESWCTYMHVDLFPCEICSQAWRRWDFLHAIVQELSDSRTSSVLWLFVSVSRPRWTTDKLWHRSAVRRPGIDLNHSFLSGIWHSARTDDEGTSTPDGDDGEAATSSDFRESSEYHVTTELIHSASWYSNGLSV